jgi:hypothetical protein
MSVKTIDVSCKEVLNFPKLTSDKLLSEGLNQVFA